MLNIPFHLEIFRSPHVAHETLTALVVVARPLVKFAREVVAGLLKVGARDPRHPHILHHDAVTPFRELSSCLVIDN